MKRSSLAFMITRFVTATATACYFAVYGPKNMAVWLRAIFVVLLLAPVIADAVRTYRFYQRNVRQR